MRRPAESIALVVCGIGLAAVVFAGSRLTSAEPEKPAPAEASEKQSEGKAAEVPKKTPAFRSGGGFGGAGFGSGGFGGGWPRGGTFFGQYMSSKRLIVVADNEKGEVNAYTPRHGAWLTQSFPVAGDRKALPTIGEDVAAFCVGNSCYAFSGLTGGWESVTVQKDQKEHLTPTVSKNVAAFCVGNSCYAFSGPTGRWKSVTVEKDPKEVLAPTVNEHFVTCMAKNRLYVFSVEKGNWSSVDLPAANLPKPATEPQKQE